MKFIFHKYDKIEVLFQFVHLSYILAFENMKWCDVRRRLQPLRACEHGRQRQRRIAFSPRIISQTSHDWPQALWREAAVSRSRQCHESTKTCTFSCISRFKLNWANTVIHHNTCTVKKKKKCYKTDTPFAHSPVWSALLIVKEQHLIGLAAQWQKWVYK